jgi:protein phosphatase
VGLLNEQVTIYKGIKESLGPLMLSSPFEKTEIFLNELNSYQIDLLNRTISAESLEDAERIVKLFEPEVTE